ncbi:MAG: oligosaccharide flippase family protein [Patescibacteria group bacterium]|jgi:O-antigen/teichoic acid export membrane protein
MKLNIKELLKDKFVRGTFFLTVANFGGAFLNYLVHPILTRRLSVAAYGDFQALLSFMAIISVLSAVINTTLIREVSGLTAKRPEEIGALRRRASRRFFWLGLVVFSLIVIFVKPLNELFKISENNILIIASLNFLYLFPSIVNRAVLSGRQEFLAMASLSFLDASARLGFIILFVAVWSFGLSGTAWALGSAGLITFLVSSYQIKKLHLPEAPIDFKPRLRKFWRYSLLVLWFMALTQFFYNFDMLFVKSSFSPEEAGLYGALLTVGRIIYFVGAAVPLVMFPVIANLKEDKSLRSYIVLGKSVALLAALAIPAYLIISLWPEFIIKIIVGSKYLSMAPYLPGFSLVMLALTLVTILSNYFLALSSRRSLIILSVAAISEIISLNLFHHNLSEIILSLGLTFGGSSLGLSLLAWFKYNKTKRKLYAEKN